MKKLTTLMAAGLGLLAYNSANAQVGLHVNLNLGGVAVHAVYNSAPVQYSSYDNDDDYYYLPDVEAYYSVPQHCYYYNDGRQWITSAYLPGQYRNYDWRTARHYEIRADRPFMHHDMYRTRYGGFDQRGGGYADNRFGPMGNGRPNDRFDNRGGFDQRGGGFDDHAYGRNERGGFDQHRNDNRDGQFQGGFDRQDRMTRGQYQNGNNDQNRGGQYQGGNPNQNNGQPQMGGNMPQNGNGQNRDGQYQGGNSGQNNGQVQGGRDQNGNGQNRGGQPQNGGASPNGGQGRSGQPTNDGQNRRNGDYQNAGSDNHFAANRMGVVRPPRF